MGEEEPQSKQQALMIQFGSKLTKGHGLYTNIAAWEKLSMQSLVPRISKIDLEDKTNLLFDLN